MKKVSLHHHLSCSPNNFPPTLEFLLWGGGWIAQGTFPGFSQKTTQIQKKNTNSKEFTLSPKEKTPTVSSDPKRISKWPHSSPVAPRPTGQGCSEGQFFPPRSQKAGVQHMHHLMVIKGKFWITPSWPEDHTAVLPNSGFAFHSFIPSHPLSGSR